MLATALSPEQQRPLGRLTGCETDARAVCGACEAARFAQLRLMVRWETWFTKNRRRGRARARVKMTKRREPNEPERKAVSVFLCCMLCGCLACCLPTMCILQMALRGAEGEDPRRSAFIRKGSKGRSSG